MHASPASFNNEAGVPLTLLEAGEDTEVVVIEMGARFAGNITELCAVAEPQVGVITHVGMAHAGLLGGREGIAHVKGELLEALDRHGTAVLDAGDVFTPALAARTRARVVTVSVGDMAGATIRAVDVVLDDELRPRSSSSRRGARLRCASRCEGHGRPRTQPWPPRSPSSWVHPSSGSPRGSLVPRRRHGGWT